MGPITATFVACLLNDGQTQNCKIRRRKDRSFVSKMKI
jgi:hypothetical protein